MPRCRRGNVCNGTVRVSELRCRCRRGEGLLSAFWLHQHDPTKQEYKPDGTRKKLGDGVLEIDIFEQQGRCISDGSSDVDLNVHFTKGAHYRPKVEIDASKEFHVWAMQWEEGELSWHLDGKVIQTYRGPTPQEKMFILVALFQYPGWIGQIDPNLKYPRDFEIDYVRAFARDAKRRTGSAVPPIPFLGERPGNACSRGMGLGSSPGSADAAGRAAGR